MTNCGKSKVAMNSTENWQHSQCNHNVAWEVCLTKEDFHFDYMSSSKIAATEDPTTISTEFPWLCSVIDKVSGAMISACAIIPNDRDNDVFTQGTKKVVTAAHIVQDTRYYNFLADTICRNIWPAGFFSTVLVRSPSGSNLSLKAHWTSALPQSAFIQISFTRSWRTILQW